MLPRHIDALPAEDRLTFCAGSIAIEWQKIIETVDMGLDLPVRDEGGKATGFGSALQEWQAVSRRSRLADVRVTDRIVTVTSSYHLLRDALVHGNPRITDRHYVEGSTKQLVEFDLKTIKHEYKGHHKKMTLRYRRGVRYKNHREWIKYVDQQERKFIFFYFLDDIQYVAAHALRELQPRIAHVNYLRRREEHFPGIGPSPACAF